jgi:hypothetical protein
VAQNNNNKYTHDLSYPWVSLAAAVAECSDGERWWQRPDSERETTTMLGLGFSNV